MEISIIDGFYLKNNIDGNNYYTFDYLLWLYDNNINVKLYLLKKDYEKYKQMTLSRYHITLDKFNTLVKILDENSKYKFDIILLHNYKFFIIYILNKLIIKYNKIYIFKDAIHNPQIFHNLLKKLNFNIIRNKLDKEKIKEDDIILERRINFKYIWQNNEENNILFNGSYIFSNKYNCQYLKKYNKNNLILSSILNIENCDISNYCQKIGITKKFLKSLKYINPFKENIFDKYNTYLYLNNNYEIDNRLIFESLYLNKKVIMTTIKDDPVMKKYYRYKKENNLKFLDINQKEYLKKFIEILNLYEK